jgi:hypothetical protein
VRPTGLNSKRTDSPRNATPITTPTKLAWVKIRTWLESAISSTFCFLGLVFLGLDHSPLPVSQGSAGVVLAVLTDHRERRQENGLEGHDHREQPVRLALDHKSDPDREPGDVEIGELHRIRRLTSCARALDRQPRSYAGTTAEGKRRPGRRTEYTDRAGVNLRFACSDRPVAQRPTRHSPPRISRIGRRRPRGQVPRLHEGPTGVCAGSHTHVLLLLRRPMVPIGR